MAKAPNYTPEMEARIREKLTGEVDHSAAIAELAEELGRKVASVRQKAVRMGLYRKAERVSKDGRAVESKAKIVARIAEAIGVPVETFDSLEKATKPVLLKLADALTADEADSQESEG